MKNFTILLYLITLFIYILNIILIKIIKDKNNYILRIVKNKNKYLNILYNLIYIIIIFPVYIDLIWIIKEQINKKV